MIAGALVAGMGTSKQAQHEAQAQRAERDQMANGEWQKGPLGFFILFYPTRRPCGASLRGFRVRVGGWVVLGFRTRRGGATAMRCSVALGSDMAARA